MVRLKNSEEVTSDMDLYGDRYERDLKNNDAFERSRKRREAEDAMQSGSQKRINRPEMEESLLTDSQVRQLRDKYNLVNMNCEEEFLLLEDLQAMGFLTKEDCETYSMTGGNILVSLKKKIGDDINLLYKMAISGRDDTLHIEHIRSQQKLLNVLEQVMED